MRARTAREAFKPLLEPISEPILHPSQWRIRALCISIVLGHPLFYVVWTYWLPQPYESLWQRLLVSALGLTLLLFPKFTEPPPTRLAVVVITLVFWLTVPVYFTWMYFCNGRNAVWLATMAAMFLIYYHATDWRLATIGLGAGIATGWLLYSLFGPQLPPPTAEEVATHVVVFAFCWYMALMLGLSASNLRREQLKQALGTMGIMAHELRTPLATMALIADAVRNEAATAPAGSATKLEHLADRLHGLLRNMNRQIDMQITNAQLMHLPLQKEVVRAAAVVRRAVAEFPYRGERERNCVQVLVVRDFEFHTSAALFRQVIDNLMKNALRSLAAMPSVREPGDLRIEVDVQGRRGRISIEDRGLGMRDEMKARIFQPFVSTDRGTGHGLGLAFCHRVIRDARGTIDVESAPGRGARFVLDLPVALASPISQPTLEHPAP
ncbi:HAMP domain-containing sensor histidine kinase [Ramlibacter sp. AN1015]|uniref:sensor histidine kinase n=1 Tax=Ramlibacter sp. AN1015 TaxID=3133428 RepID=UPI0030C3A768